MHIYTPTYIHAYIHAYIHYTSHIFLKDRDPHYEEPSRKRTKLNMERINNWFQMSIIIYT